MASELKGCPFCGSDNVGCYETYSHYACQCNKCGATMTLRGERYKAVRAWNQRAERTCNRVIKTNERPGKTVFNQWYACSECGNPMGSGENFCASCGARIVGD